MPVYVLQDILLLCCIVSDQMCGSGPLSSVSVFVCEFSGLWIKGLELQRQSSTLSGPVVGQ